MPTEFLHSKIRPWRWCLARGYVGALDSFTAFLPVVLYGLISTRLCVGATWVGYSTATEETVLTVFSTLSQARSEVIFTIREIWSPVYIDKLFVTGSFDGRVAVENRSLFSRLGEYSMRYAVYTEEGDTIEGGNVTLPDIGRERGPLSKSLSVSSSATATFLNLPHTSAAPATKCARGARR